jgi:hypothetical protein
MLLNATKFVSQLVDDLVYPVDYCLSIKQATEARKSRHCPMFKMFCTEGSAEGEMWLGLSVSKSVGSPVCCTRPCCGTTHLQCFVT